MINRILFDYIRRMNGDTIEILLEALDMSRNTYYGNMTGKSKRGFTHKHIQFFVDRWNLTPMETYEIFFNHGGGGSDERLRYE